MEVATSKAPSESARAAGFATAELHHQLGRDPLCPLFARRARVAVAEASFSPLARELFELLLAQHETIKDRIDRLDKRIVALCREDEACRRLAALPGVGPVTATALVASVGDARQLRSGRELAAWIGLVPRQYSTGGKPRLGGIGRRANHYLRKQMVHGARAVAIRLEQRSDPRSRWFRALIERRGLNKAIVVARRSG